MSGVPSKAAVVLAVLALGLAACGSDDNSEPAEPADPEDRAAYIEQVDQICDDDADFEAVEEDFERARLEHNEAPAGSDEEAEAREETAGAVDELVQLAEGHVERRAAVAPPVEDREIIAEIAQTQTQGIELLRTFSEAIRAESQEEAEGIAASLERLTNRVNDLSRGYGFKVCGSEEG